MFPKLKLVSPETQSFLFVVFLLLVFQMFPSAFLLL